LWAKCPRNKCSEVILVMLHVRRRNDSAPGRGKKKRKPDEY
jgi:hypothetical protein